MSDRDGDKYHPPPIMLEGRDEGGVLLGLLHVILVASDVLREPNLCEDEGT